MFRAKEIKRLAYPNNIASVALRRRPLMSCIRPRVYWRSMELDTACASACWIQYVRHDSMRSFLSNCSTGAHEGTGAGLGRWHGHGSITQPVIVFCVDYDCMTRPALARMLRRLRANRALVSDFVRKRTDSHSWQRAPSSLHLVPVAPAAAPDRLPLLQTRRLAIRRCRCRKAVLAHQVPRPILSSRVRRVLRLRRRASGL
jgi:hypothetical protein